MISVHTPKFVLGLVAGILAVTFVPIGVVFTIVFGTLGIPFLAVGLVLTAVAVLFFTRGRARRRREEAARVSHATGRVVTAEYRWGTRINGRHPVKLTLELAGGRHTNVLLVPPNFHWAPGQTIAVLYAPDNPANFIPVL